MSTILVGLGLLLTFFRKISLRDAAQGGLFRASFQSGLDEMDLKRLSAELNLSPTTVSRALNGYPEVSSATRARVAAAAELHGYRPNARAKGLATGRSMVIGHVLTPTTAHEMVNPLFGDFIAGTSSAFAASGYDIMFSRVGDASEETAYRALKSQGAVDGVILQGPSVNDPRIEFLNRIDLPYVVHGRSSGVETDYPWVDVNNTQAFFRATEFLISLGHRRIGLINGIADMDFAYRRREGYRRALDAGGLALDPALVRSGEMTEIQGAKETASMLEADNPPSAILAASMISALGVRRAIESKGLVMGRDVSVITFDDVLSYLKNGEDVPIFTAMRSGIADAGGHVAALLMDIISGQNALPRRQLLEAELVLGNSTGPAPGR